MAFLKIQFGHLCPRATMPWLKRVFLRKSLTVPPIRTILINSFQEKERTALFFPVHSLLPKTQTTEAISTLSPNAKNKTMCAYFCRQTQTGKSSFLGGMLTELHDTQEKPRESCRRRGFTCAPGNISIPKKPGGLQHWRLATKTSICWALVYVIHSIIN